MVEYEVDKNSTTYTSIKIHTMASFNDSATMKNMKKQEPSHLFDR